MKKEEIKVEQVDMMGMPLQRWTYESCIADFGIDPVEKWATLYYIESSEEGKGHATHLLEVAKVQFVSRGFKFGGTVALNDRMARLYKKLEIEEYT